MWEHEESIDISAPPDKVYDYLSDFTRHSEWSMSVTALEQVTPGKVGVGTEFKSSESLPQEFVSFAHITALDAPERIAWESTDRQVFRTNWEFAISPKAGGTHLVQRVIFHPISSFGGEFLSVRKLQVPTENLKSLGRIKEILERKSSIGTR